MVDQADRPLVIVPNLEDEQDLSVARDALGDAGRLEPLADSGDERQRQLETARALLVFAWHLGDDEIPLMEQVSLVQSVWAGVDRLPVQRLQETLPNAQIASGSGPNAVQVAEHAVGLYLDCAKRITLRDRDMRKGGWMQRLPGRRIAGSRIAVLGLGAIGTHVARLLVAMGAEVTGVTRNARVDDEELENTIDACSPTDLQARLGEHNGIVICLPLTATTEGLVDRRFLQAMPRDGILVNVARGKIVEEDALYEHLSANPDFMAGLDVWWRYPKKGQPRPQNHPFERLDNVVMTPHSAFNVPGSRQEMIQNAAANIARHLRGKPAKNVVRSHL